MLSMRPGFSGRKSHHVEDHQKQDRNHRDESTFSSSRRSRSGSPSIGRRSRSPTRRQRDGSRSRRSSSRTREKKRKCDVRSRSRSLDKVVDPKKHNRRSCSISSSSDVGEGLSHRKKRKRKRSRSNERRKDKKRERKERKEKKKKEKTSTPHWGKYGIISDTDIFRKDQEFRTWLVEERKINPETVSKDVQKKEFARFTEDYNTATLPHEKYYNMEAYERRMSALRQGEYVPPSDDLYDFQADLKAVSSAHKKKSPDQDTYMTKEQLMELRKVQQQRNEIGRMKLLGMDVKQNFGVRMDTTYD